MTDSARLFVYDDSVAGSWDPFTLTRPAGEMLFGTETLRARIERVFGIACRGHIASEALLGFEEPGAPGIEPLGSVGTDGTRLFVNSRFVPAENVGRAMPPGPALLLAGSRIVGALVPCGTPVPDGLFADAPLPEWPSHPVAGQLLETVWGLMAANVDRLRTDGLRFGATSRPAGAHKIGEGPVVVADGAEIEPGVLLDTSGGPIILDRGARVQGPARLGGPLYLGPHSVLLGGVVEGASIGPHCRIRGEVESSVILGFTNKAHDGFLGHSIVGRWVNLGAMTSNSDLKNSYGPVRLRIADRTIHTGLVKVGCFLGDHVRTGIGTLLNTGTVVGACSNLFGGRTPPRDVPPFSWGSGSDLSEYDLERFLHTARRVMDRRSVPITEGMEGLYRRAHEGAARRRESTRPR